jgi:hypothetical protein
MGSASIRRCEARLASFRCAAGGGTLPLRVCGVNGGLDFLFEDMMSQNSGIPKIIGTIAFNTGMIF